MATLRKTYGEHFAKGRRKDMMLKTLLAETGTDSLTLTCASIINSQTEYWLLVNLMSGARSFGLDAPFFENEECDGCFVWRNRRHLACD